MVCLIKNYVNGASNPLLWIRNGSKYSVRTIEHKILLIWIIKIIWLIKQVEITCLIPECGNADVKQSLKSQNIETLQGKIFNSMCTEHHDVDCFRILWNAIARLRHIEAPILEKQFILFSPEGTGHAINWARDSISAVQNFLQKKNIFFQRNGVHALIKHTVHISITECETTRPIRCCTAVHKLSCLSTTRARQIVDNSIKGIIVLTRYPEQITSSK